MRNGERQGPKRELETGRDTEEVVWKRTLERSGTKYWVLSVLFICMGAKVKNKAKK